MTNTGHCIQRPFVARTPFLRLKLYLKKIHCVNNYSSCITALIVDKPYWFAGESGPSKMGNAQIEFCEWLVHWLIMSYTYRTPALDIDICFIFVFLHILIVQMRTPYCFAREPGPYNIDQFC